MAYNSRKSRTFAFAFVALAAFSPPSPILRSQQAAEKSTPAPAVPAATAPLAHPYLDPLEDPIVMRPAAAPVVSSPPPQAAPLPAACKGKACRSARQSRTGKAFR